MRTALIALLGLGLAAAPAAPLGAQAAAGALRPGDRIIVSRRDTVEQASIRPDGRVVLPLVGALSLAGLTPSAAEDSVTRALAAFSRRPDLRVVALRRIIVQGAVRRPDLYFAESTVGLAEALGMAGGVAEDGHRGKVDLYRDGQRIGRYDSRTPSTLQVALHSGDLIVVGERSWWSRNPGVVVSALASIVTVVAVLAQ
jgi:protein involved in polysaccharide export with SLBB domain